MDIFYKLHNLDTRLFFAIFRQRDKIYLRQIARSISRTADGYFFILTPLLSWQMKSPHAHTITTLLLYSIVTERCLYWLLKNGLRRPRPNEAMPDLHNVITAADRFSFPSGHTSASFVFATSLAVVYVEPAIVAYVWASAVGLSRIILGAHYPGDTLAGAAMGTVVTLLIASYSGLLT